MKFVATTALALAAAALVPLPATHAQPSRVQFLTPSGNVGCQLGTDPEGAAYAWCKVDDHQWATPDDRYCPAAYLPGSIGRPTGDNLQLSAGKAPCVGFVMSQLFFTGEYAPPTLEYGQQQSSGPITCSVERSGVKCADSSTGHSFEVSRESYELN